MTRRQTLADRVAVRAVRGDEGRHADHSRIGKQLGHLAYPPDVLAAILRREPQVGAQPVADVVAIQHVAEHSEHEQLAFQFGGDRRLARTGQAGQPHHAARVALAQRPLLGGDAA